MTISDAIFFAHMEARQPILIHGSSGYGKTSMARDFPARHGLRVVEEAVPFLNFDSILVPHKNMDLGFDIDVGGKQIKSGLVSFVPSGWLYEITRPDCPPTVLILDEYNRASSVHVYNLCTQILLDRKINGLKISDNVLIIATANLSLEDTGVTEIPDAVMRRFTHFVHIPSLEERISHFPSELARGMARKRNKMLKEPDIGQEVLERLNECDRQFNQSIALWETGKLSLEELRMCMVGKMGVEHGNINFADFRDYLNEVNGRLPREISEDNFADIADYEQNGHVTEIVGFLKDQSEKPQKAGGDRLRDLCARYLILHATPETCRAMVEYNRGEATSREEKKLTTEERPLLCDHKFYAMPAGFELIPERRVSDEEWAKGVSWSVLAYSDKRGAKLSIMRKAS